jgi:aspartate dehydrogenase
MRMHTMDGPPPSGATERATRPTRSHRRNHVRVLVIGLGSVGHRLADLVADGAAGRTELVGFLVRDPRRHARYAERSRIPVITDHRDALALDPDLVVEAAGHDAFRSLVPVFLEAGVDVLAISAGALADPDTLASVTDAAERGGSRLRIPSGAIAGLDAISAAAVGRLERVVHDVRKPPNGLLGPDEAAAVTASGEPRVLFEGTAREAAIRFPANVNVVAAVSLAGLGLDRTTTRVIADPRITRNTHRVEVEGDFGRLTLTIENTPSDNPKTGVIVALSLARVLRAYAEPIVVGG